MRAKKRALAAGGFGGIALLATVFGSILPDSRIDWTEIVVVVLSLVLIGVLVVPVLFGVRDRIRMWLAVAATIVMCGMSVVGGALTTLAVLWAMTFSSDTATLVWAVIAVLAGGIATGFGIATVIGLMPAPKPIVLPPPRPPIATPA